MERKTGYVLENLGVSLSDFFGGYHKPYMAIPVFHGMTKVQLMDAIESEWNQIYDHLTYGDNAWPDFESEEIRKMADEFIHVDVLFLDLEEEDEEDEDRESVYIHISCEEDPDYEEPSVEKEDDGMFHCAAMWTGCDARVEKEGDKCFICENDLDEVEIVENWFKFLGECGYDLYKEDLDLAGKIAIIKKIATAI